MLAKALERENNLAWLRDEKFQKALSIDHWSAAPEAGKLSFYAPNFALDAKQPWLWGEEVEWPAVSPQPLPGLKVRREPSADRFGQVHAEILQAVARGDFSKVVPIVAEDLEFDSFLSPFMFPAAFEKHPQQFSYGFSFQEEGMAGVTPEVLFTVEDGALHTMALAGTGPSHGPDLLKDDKECREHEVVIEHIAGALKALGRVEVGQTQEKTYGSLKHLHTPIRVNLERAPSFMELVARLHPTAALGGWPREAALNWLQEQDFHRRRRRFGAPFGWQQGNSMFCVVAIRCLQWKNAQALLASGCGVVVGSQSDREWKELQLKRRAIIQNLGLSL